MSEKKTKPATKVKPVKAAKRGRKKKTGLLIPHVRVLRALKRAKWNTLGRTQLAERAGFSPISGTINRALAGIKKDSPQAKKHGCQPHKGLLDLGLVEEVRLDDESKKGWVYKLTKEGDKALEKFEGTVGEVRDRKTCVNTRYVKAQEKEKAKRAKQRAKKAAAKEKPPAAVESNGEKVQEESLATA